MRESISAKKKRSGWPQPWKGRSGISLVKERIEEESDGLLTIKNKLRNSEEISNEAPLNEDPPKHH